MPAYKDSRQGTWYAAFYFENWKGMKQKKLKRGFATKKDALAWEREFLLQQAADLTMTFEAFVEIYITDKKKRLRENTWSTKEHIIRTKILPYFKEKRLSEIKPRDVIAWQNEMLNYRDKNGKAYSPTYLKTLHGQLSAILNHAVRFYGLKSNAAATAGCMGSEKHKEMLFWTKEEYLKFAEAMMDKPQSYYAFEVLYWCGIREGELLALTPADFDLDKGLLSITKSYQRLKGRDVITDPKTPKSVRVIQMPQFLTDEIRDYLKSLYKVQPDQRIFEVTKSYLHHEMDRGAKEAGVKRIRIHDLRHSHVSLLIEMGFSALAIADRVGHESVDITYKYAHLFPSKQQEMAQKLDALGQSITKFFKEAGHGAKGGMKMERVLDQQGRWRNKVVAFRMSPEEDEVLEAKVRLSGLTKQEYIIRRLTDREITVVGNPRVYKALRGQMELIYQELQRLVVDEEVPPDLLETLQMVALTLNGLKEECE